MIDDADDEKRARKRLRDAENARLRRERRRRASQESLQDGHATGATAPRGGLVGLPARTRKVTPVDISVTRLLKYDELLEADQSVSIIDKQQRFQGSVHACAAASNAMVNVAKADELRERIEYLERALLHVRNRRSA